MNRSWQWRTSLALGVFFLASGLPVAGADKDPDGKLSTELYGLAVAAERGQAPPVGVRSYDAAKQRVVVVIELAKGADPASVTNAVRAAGGELLVANMGFLKVSLPPRALREVSAHGGVLLIRAPHAPSPKRSPRSPRSQSLSQPNVTSQGRATMRADEFSARTGADGSGVRVGILDGGFKGARGLIGSELPDDTQATDRVLQRLASDSYGSVHGTACAEIVHDVAPGAKLVLADFDDEVDWGQAVDQLAGSGVKIISHSIGFDNLYPPNGSHPFAAKADAAAAGVLFVTAAGNEGENYFQGTRADTNNNGFLEYGGVTEFLPVAGASKIVRLRWDDTYGAAAHDYDLYVVDEAFKSNPDISFPAGDKRIVGRSEDAQRNSGNPLETVMLDSNEDVLYVVIRHDPATPVNPSQRLWLWAHKGVAPQFTTAPGSLSLPGDARGAVTVGAVHWSSRAVESYSSRGPTSDGRVKPDLAAPDAVDTASYDGQPFTGTSAATPHAAGAAALLLSRTPSLSVSALRAALESAGGSSKNNDTGTGLIDLSRVR